MKLHNYICDSCGTTDDSLGNEISSLSSLFQHPYENIGTRHVCKGCRNAFKDHFKAFFKHLNKVVAMGINAKR